MAFAFNPITGKLDLVGSGGSATTDASLLTSGTIADARLSSNVSLDNLDNSFSVGQTITAPANNSALTASYSVTEANTTPLLNLSGTWNTTGTARGILLNITDSASAGSSALLDLQTFATSRFRIAKNGTVNAVAIYASNSFFGGTGSQISTTGLTVGSNASIFWKNNANVELGTSDLFLSRDAANTLALRNGGTAGTPVPQNFRVYNWGDTTNYERGFMRWNSNVLEIGTEAGGTGTARVTRISSASFAEINVPTGQFFNININNINRFGVGGTGNISYSNLIVNSGSNLRLAGSVTPASSTATGTRGDIQWDADYIYVCTATNTWKRAALSTW
jgi:hypothetical protein